MNRVLAFKLGAIALLILLLLIPLNMIGGMIDERQQYQRGVLQDIARSSSYSQQILGPILVQPYVKTVKQWKTNEQTGKRYEEEREVSGHLYFLPERFAFDADMTTERRARGIYEALLYHSDSKVSGMFHIPPRLGLGDDLDTYRLGAPFLSVGISDIRGIRNGLQLQLNGQTLPFAPGSGAPIVGSGIHAKLPALDREGGQPLEFAFDLKLQGTEHLRLVPVGRDSQVLLSGDWPHPSFFGEFLPNRRQVDTSGFTAEWQTSFFATNLEEVLQQCGYSSECKELLQRSFGVSFLDPVNQYLKTDRAIKYALLFLALTFATFFLFEILKRLAVHPVQYALVGLALALFYLLLLSLSEHIAFAKAYVLSAAACVGLIGFYTSSVLHSWRRGLGFALLLAALYGLLYGLLSAEDYALLMGSLLVFGVLGCTMVLTRKLNWYSVGRSASQDKKS
ncbi:cell envelope integrity protein CreD [Microbulbifer sp. 2205BS26-8]|uniref:cell envelope integrity protein CreD n=1 Tax=Microbulbifer sp. 2205BS26-8 TaxID=3064386 RepID=UPI00273F7814|nr:cell envelope integrity protein CreD [Microbulbifer sp. 2205BS26-8]MDP5210933.1 cell envelope integrity protein CreD [Microbulbifer sp. 2205BS26-8]